MKLSLITPSFNSADTIRDTIESVLGQNYPDIEYIVIDGGSTDDTLKIVSEYGDRVDRVLSEKDQGIYDAMNKGVRLATGEIVGIINSDDLLISPQIIEQVMRLFEGDQSPDIVYGDLFIVSRENPDRIVRHWIAGERRSFASGWHPAHPAFFVRRKLYEQAGLFDTTFRLAADFELMLRFFEKTQAKSVYLAEPFVRMRRGGASDGSLRSLIRQNRECILAFRKNNLPVSPLYPLYRLLPKLRQFRFVRPFRK